MTKEKRNKKRDSPERESKIKIKQEKESPVRPHRTRRSRSRSNSPRRTSRYFQHDIIPLLIATCCQNGALYTPRRTRKWSPLSTCIYFFKLFRTRDRSSGRRGTPPSGRGSRSPRNRRSGSPHRPDVRVKRVIMFATIIDTGHRWQAVSAGFRRAFISENHSNGKLSTHI